METGKLPTSRVPLSKMGIFIGTSGYNYKHWKNIFYPKDIAQKDWMVFYADHFGTVEINATFYRDFQKSVYEKWKDITPQDFKFTIKGSKWITHFGKLKDVNLQVDRFADAISGLDKKLALVLWQFPYSFKATEETTERLETFLQFSSPKFPQAFEFRHKTWLNEDVYEILNKYGAGFVITDSPRFPTEEVVTGKIAYVRFHGPNRLYSSSYSDDQLEEWAKKIMKWSKKVPVFVYFNNDNQGFALDNAKTLKRILGV